MRRSQDRVAPIVKPPKELRKRLRLNAWQRFGVVISCAWVLASVYWDCQIYDQMYWARRDAAEQICLSENPQNVLKCGPLKEPNGFTPPSIFQFRFLANAVGPVILGWGLTYFLVATAKWVLAGRKISN